MTYRRVSVLDQIPATKSQASIRNGSTFNGSSAKLPQPNRNVDRLSDADGRSLLQKIGVQGTAAQIDRLVSTWDGHALMLSLLGFY